MKLAPIATTRSVLRMRFLPAALALACLAVTCGGCGRSGGNAPVETEFYPFTAAEAAVRDSTIGARYRLRAGDVFSVDFKYEDELDQPAVLVLPDGRFSIAGASSSTLPAAGLTVAELDSVLTTEFARDYVNAELSVMLNEVADRKVYVLGEVEDPGLYPIPRGGEGILPAVALAGGFTKHARKSEVLLVRVTTEGYLYRKFDLNHIGYGGLQQAGYLDLQPYDVIYVPRSSLGNLAYFGETVLATTLQVSRLFWDVYAITHLEKVDRLVR